MAKPLTIDEPKTKIYDLTKRLFELNRDKKAEMKNFSEEDKELKNEIEEALEKKEKKAMPEAEAKSKVFEATRKRIEIKKEKKAVATDYKDQIGDVTSEIFAIFAEQKDQNTVGTNP